MKPELKKSLERWPKEYPYPIMGLIEAMREVQEKELHVSAEAEAYLAQLFKTTVTHVHGVATFFPYFTQEKTGKHRIGLCHGLSCAMAGADKAAKCLQDKLGVDEKETTKDGRFSWEEMECLGACEQAPALQVNEEMKGKATEDLISKLVETGK